VILLSCLIAVTVGQTIRRNNVLYERLANGRTRCRATLNCGSAINNFADCPVIDCPINPRPPFDSSCSAPDCSVAANRQYLHPSTDPFSYWQCARIDALGNWAPKLRDCACPTAFDYGAQRCVFVHELTAAYFCNAWNPFPTAP